MRIPQRLRGMLGEQEKSAAGCQPDTRHISLHADERTIDEDC